MKIYVSRIPPEGLREDVAYDPAALDVDRFDIHPGNPIAVSAYVTKAEREVIVQAEISCAAELSCARCLQSFTRPLHASTIFAYEVMPTDVVDITEDVRQELILAYPMAPVCQEGCKGLCPVCGQNLNLAACQHQVR